MDLRRLHPVCRLRSVHSAGRFVTLLLHSSSRQSVGHAVVRGLRGLVLLLWTLLHQACGQCLSGQCLSG